MAVTVQELLTPEIQQPARYLGNELGAAHKPWDAATVRWVLTYPEIYEVGASNLGHIILYNILNAQPRQLCDRAYLPASDLAAKLRSTQTPLFAVESRRPLTDFDILGFSLGYELGATNILEMLALASIPLTWQERMEAAEHRKQETERENQSSGFLSYPLIFAGGQTATSNPEPFADFFDFMALGDGEELLPEIGLVIAEGKQQGLSREALLLDLAQIPGVYVPQFYDMAPDGSVHRHRPDVPERILRRVAPPMPAYSIGLVPYIETVHDRLVIEVRRGCTRGCRFCQPGMLTRPARDVAPDEVIQAIEQGMRATGRNEFSLLSLSCSDYLSLPAVGMEIRNRLKTENITLSLPSQRVDRFDENIANIIGGNRQSGLTFAPEAGTQRMRDIINKGLTNEELLRGVKTAFEQGWDKIKLYFMIGLPGETDEDVLGIAETVGWLQQQCRAAGRRLLNFNLTISNFTPKPHTPFQWHSVAAAEFQRKQALLRAEFRRMKGIKANFTDVRLSAMEDFIGRGDRRLAPIIRRAWELGAGSDAWWESLDRAFAAWTQAIEEARGKEAAASSQEGLEAESISIVNILPHFPTLQSPTPRLPVSVPQPSSPVANLDQPLPWDHIDTGIDKNWLKADWQRALEAITVPDCSFDGCSHCGVCGPDLGHNVVISAPPIPPYAGNFVPNHQRVQRLRVWFGKLGDMALVSHLDLIRLLDRALRRAALPIAFTGGFHPSPRIIPVQALSLGATSSGEIVDFELREWMEGNIFRERLAAQLPTEIPLYRVEEVDLKAPSANQLLDQAEYMITVRVLESPQDTPQPILSPPVSPSQWASWIAAILASPEIKLEQTTKSGKKKVVNLRERLFELEQIEPQTNPQLSGLDPKSVEAGVKLRYVGSCRQDGALLRPEHIIYMLEQVAQQKFQLCHTHRCQLILHEAQK